MSTSKITADKTFSLKDRLFNATTVELLATGLKRADSSFRAAAFKNARRLQGGHKCTAASVA